MKNLNHFNKSGEAHMIDVGSKQTTHRVAVSTGTIHMQAATLEKILEGTHKKGDVLSIARIAGIMASKRTADLIPLCHPLPLTHVEIDLKPQPKNNSVLCTTTTETIHVTGVEMESLTATQITLLTIYDMCKAIDKGMVISNIQLIEKKGGKSGHWKREQ